MDGLLPSPNRGLHQGDLGVERFALQVVTQIAGTTHIESGAPDRELLSLIVRYARTGHDELLDLIMARIRRARLPAETIVDVYVPSAARKIGNSWHEGELDILQTSVAISRLQTMLRVIGRHWQADASSAGSQLRVVVAVPEKEQHTLGAVVVTHQLRRLGVSVSLQLQPSATKLLMMLQDGQYDAIMLSISNRCLLEDCRKLVKTIKRGVGIGLPVVIGGPLLRQDDLNLEQYTGADLVTHDVTTALTAFGLMDHAEAAQ